MRCPTRVSVGVSFVGWILVSAGTAQVAGSLRGNVFQYPAVGLTYTLPKHFTPKVGNELPQTVSGTEHMVLALWDSPECSGLPRMMFLYDTKASPAAWSREQIALSRLREVRQTALQAQGAKVSRPKKISAEGDDRWRLDYLIPDDSAPYNSAVAILLSNRNVLTVQLNARSQHDLDEEVDSLHDLHVDQNRP
jgi:hypothetical protein